jgi:VIT1/CCC1 family predicted Fe2+/Mn2+ transporter
MADGRNQRSGRVLDPIARVSEVLFGLIMALTFTGTLSAATAGREEVRTLLIGVIGCNIAWGLVDAVMFLMSALSERGHSLLTVQAVRSAPSADAAHSVIAAAIPPVVASLLKRDALETVRVGLVGMNDLPPSPKLTKDDWLGAAAVFLLVFLSTFPIVIPFLIFRDVRFALRISNLIALVMLFITGSWLARHGGHHPLWTGLTMMLIGVVLVGITIALGG